MQIVHDIYTWNRNRISVHPFIYAGMSEKLFTKFRSVNRWRITPPLWDKEGNIKGIDFYNIQIEATDRTGHKNEIFSRYVEHFPLFKDIVQLTW